MSRPSCARDIRTRRAAALFFLTSPGPVALLAFAFLLAACKTVLLGWGRSDLVVAALIVTGWEFLEWAVHRYLMHAEPLPVLHLRIRSPLHATHQEHHRHPDAIDNVLFGPLNALLAVVVVAGLAALLLRDAGMFLSLAMLLALMLVRYDWFHLLSHSSVVPASGLMQRLVAGHRQHHERNGVGRYGVSGVVVDGLLLRGPRP